MVSVSCFGVRVSVMFHFMFVHYYYLFISHFGFKSGICLLIAPVPVHCFLLLLTNGSGGMLCH